MREWLGFTPPFSIVYVSEDKLHSMKCWWCPLGTTLTTLDLHSVHWKNQFAVRCPLHWHITLFRVKQSLFLLLDSSCLALKEKITILWSLLWPYQSSKSWPTTLEVFFYFMFSIYSLLKYFSKWKYKANCKSYAFNIMLWAMCVIITVHNKNIEIKFSAHDACQE